MAKDLSRYPRRGLGPLTEQERRIIQDMEPEMARYFLAGVIRQSVMALASQSNEHNAAARAIGFENAEHEVLAFLGSEWFEQIAGGLFPGRDGLTPTELAQRIVDEAYGPDVLGVVELDEPAELVHRDGPRGTRGYLPPLVGDCEPGTMILARYDQQLRHELCAPDQIVLELPGLTLLLEETDEVCRA